jgi:hypothetical protein
LHKFRFCRTLQVFLSVGLPVTEDKSNLQSPNESEEKKLVCSWNPARHVHVTDILDHCSKMHCRYLFVSVFQPSVSQPIPNLIVHGQDDKKFLIWSFTFPMSYHSWQSLNTNHQCSVCYAGCLGEATLSGGAGREVTLSRGCLERGDTFPGVLGER